MDDLVLVLNCGSSSIKFTVLSSSTYETVLGGMVQCVGQPEALLTWEVYSSVASDTPIKTHHQLAHIDYESALRVVLSRLKHSQIFEHITVVGHRVVHGGEFITESVRIDESIIDIIRRCSDLAPLHDPVNLKGIQVAQAVLGSLPHVAVFDTAFHQTMPPYAYLYALPYSFYKKYHVRRYGFHGTSHHYVTREAAKRLKKPLRQCALISAHLGNGCSVTAVLNGKSVDTSMGFTPLEGLMMGTRSGDIDPGLVAYLSDHLKYDIHQVTQLLNKKSGLLGVSGVDSDMRAILNAAERGESQAQLAIDMFCYRLAKYIASFFVPLGRLDALIFTGGIGENAVLIREKVLQWLAPLGFVVNAESNRVHGRDEGGCITETDSKQAFVISTHEDRLIAEEAIRLTSFVQ
jgi:acetate kinase